MAHNFYIGKPTVEQSDYPEGPRLLPKVKPITTPEGEEPVHTDQYEFPPDVASGERAPSFRAWEQVVDGLPAFKELWFDLREYATERYEPAYIPVAFYVDRLDKVEDEALSALDDPKTEPLAQRALWFVRWSRYAYEQHGEMAAFQSGEPLAFR